MVHHDLEKCLYLKTFRCGYIDVHYIVYVKYRHKT